MCDPTGIAVGAAIGAATSAATGSDPLQGAILGGATGGFFPGSVGVNPILGPTLPGASSLGVGVSLTGAGTVTGIGVAQATGVGLAAGVARQAFFPQQDYSQYYNQAGFDPIAFNTQQSVVTGSGGRQAAAVLASEIKQAKKVRQRQAEEATGFGLGMDLAGTGLQIA